jgi:antitoxin YefM
METIFRIKPEELDERLLSSIKAAFPHRTIEVRVSDTFQDDEDETAYLMRSPANRAMLLRRIADIERGENLVIPDQSQFE